MVPPYQAKGPLSQTPPRGQRNVWKRRGKEVLVWTTPAEIGQHPFVLGVDGRAECQRVHLEATRGTPGKRVEVEVRVRHGRVLIIHPTHAPQVVAGSVGCTQQRFTVVLGSSTTPGSRLTRPFRNHLMARFADVVNRNRQQERAKSRRVIVAKPFRAYAGE